MIDGLKPYPAMKDSGVPWLGEVPVHWEVRKLKYAVSFSGGGTPSKAEASFWGGRIPWVSPKDMTRARIADSMDHITEEAVSASATSIVSPGALLMVVRSGILRRTIPVAINVVEVALNQDMKALRPRAGVVASDYLRALVQGNEGALIQEWTKQGATVESIEHEFLANSRVPLPPLPEQTAIVRFLDYADRRIRRYIRAKQKLIKLLEEQKQAIIHRAVTRGLDPNVRLKPSGVEWLGDVPEHWEVLPLKRVAWFKSGAGFPVGEQGCRDGEIPFLRVSDMTRAGNEIWVETADSTVSRETARRLGAFVFPANSIIFPKVGGALLTNKRRLLRVPSCIDNNLMACVVRGARVDFAFTLFQQLDLGKLAKPGPVPAIGEGDVREIKVALPPAEEQLEIVNAVRAGTALAVTAISSAQREITLLGEYRTRLIADVVTGKLDVREAAARLPDEVEEPEPLDETEAEGDADDAGVGDADEMIEEAET